MAKKTAAAAISQWPLVRLRWIDSCSPQGWHDQDSFDDYTPDNIESVGWVIREDDVAIIISAHVGSSQVDGTICIPKVAILERTPI